jgi:hypothetical protein
MCACCLPNSSYSSDISLQNVTDKPSRSLFATAILSLRPAERRSSGIEHGF